MDPYLHDGDVTNEPKEPEDLTIEDFRAATDENARRKLQFQQNLIERQHRQYEGFKAARQHLRTYINTTVSERGKLPALSQRTLRDMMLELKYRYAPSDYEQHQMLRAELDELRNGSKTKNQFDWLYKWQVLDSKMKRYQLPERNTMAQMFIHAITDINKSFGDALLYDFIREQELRKEPRLDKYIQRYESYLHHRPQAKPSATYRRAFANQTTTDSESLTVEGSDTSSRSRSTTPQRTHSCAVITKKPADKACNSFGQCDVINQQK